MSKKFSKKIMRVQAYESGMVRVKFFFGKEELESVGLTGTIPAAGCTATAVLQAFEWDSWREDERTAPKVFGSVTFEVEAATWEVNKKKPNDPAFVELQGFIPTDEASTGRAVLPSFEQLLKFAPKREEVRQVRDI